MQTGFLYLSNRVRVLYMF